MNKRMITQENMVSFITYLRNDEKSEHTISKYLHDVRYFTDFLMDQEIDKSTTLAYKALLAQTYTISSANSMIAALNTFLRFMGWTDCCIKQFKVQKKVFCSEAQELTRKEYVRLVRTASQLGNHRLCLILQTICATGIRVSELPFITVEAVQQGAATVSCKSKTRTVFLVRELQKKLLQYIKQSGITSGSVFITRKGNVMNRCNIWREMKALCAHAKVSPKKVFPHNLRHLFARIFYGIEKDIVKLSDILGHSNINTTRIYIMSTGAEHQRKLEIMRLTI